LSAKRALITDVKAVQRHAFMREHGFDMPVASAES